jgi:hypothetical protein
MQFDNVTHHEGKLTILKRLKSSINGNPRFLCQLDKGNIWFQFRTRPDSSLAYELEYYDGKQVAIDVGYHYGVATLGSIKLLTNTVEG